MRKKQLEERRRRNRELAARDAKNRCGICKRELPKVGVKMLWQDPRMFCSDDCLKDAEAGR